MGLSLVTGPTEEPASLAEVKAHLRVDFADDDGLIAGYVLAARQHIERICGISIVSQTWDASFDGDWPWQMDADSEYHFRQIELTRAPLQSVTTVSYIDTAGVSQTLSPSEYTVDVSSRIGRIYPVFGASWPAVRCQPKAITVRFVAGFGDSSAVPDELRHAILLLVGHWYENREAVSAGSFNEMPMATQSLIAPFRIYY